MKAVRDALAVKQPDFAALLAAEAKRQGRTWLRYDTSLVSRLENGARMLYPDDAAVIAGIDPERRGAFWLLWGEQVTAELPDAAKDRKLTEDELDRATQAAARAAVERKRRSKAKRRRGEA